MLDPTAQFIVDLFILLACAVFAGELAARLGQASLVGQLLAGVLLGPTLLGPYIGLSSLSTSLVAIQTIAVIFVLFWAGLQVSPDQIYRMGWNALVLGLAAFFVPFGVLSVAAGPVLHVGAPENLYVALTLSITALPVMGIMLAEFGLRGSRLGTLVINAALVNEFAAVSIFAILQRLGTSAITDLRAIAIAVASLALFLVVILVVHELLKALRETNVWPSLTKAYEETWRSKQGNFAILMIGVLAATLFSQLLGLTYVVGAFYAGLLVTRESAGAQAHESITGVFDALNWGLLVPLFFVFVGVSMNLQLLGTSPILAGFIVLLALAIITKVATGSIIASSSGWRAPDSLAIGHLINSRGAVELAMAILLLAGGIFNVQVFTIVAAIGLVTTMLAPIGATQSWLNDPESRTALYERVPGLRPRLRKEPPGPVPPTPLQAEGGGPTPP
jgi:Kef-type K+ transport system membrane component KefB